MTRLARALLALAAIAAAALPLSACEATDGLTQALDCVTLTDRIAAALANMNADPATVAGYTADLRTAAEDVEDPELRAAVEGFADGVDEYAELHATPAGSLTAEQIESLDAQAAELADQAATIGTECADVTG